MQSGTAEHNDQVREFFDDRVAAYDAFYDELSPFRRWFNRTFRKAVYLRRNHVITLAKRYGCRTLLDVGCGSGQNTVWFVHHGIEHALGLDVSAAMVEESISLAEQAGVADHCRFEVGDFMSLDPGERFDMVCALGVFDYVEYPEPFLARMAELADRVIYGSFPGWTLVRSPLRKVRYALRRCPTHFYRRTEVNALFEAVGFGPAHLQPVPSGCLAWAAKAGIKPAEAREAGENPA